MNSFVFALKRVMRRPMIVGMLVIYVIAVAFSGRAGSEISLPCAGVYDESQSEASRRIVSYLTDNGFVVCESPEEMTALVRDGQLDCGVILPENLIALMERNDLEERIPWIVAPTSFIPGLYRDHVAAALFREYAPYITANLFEGTVVSREEVFREYEEMFAGGYAFSFDDIIIEGGAAAESSNRRALVTGVSAILLCAIVFAFCADTADASFQAVIRRMGLWKAVTGTVIPGLLVRMLLAGCAGCAGLFLADGAELIGPLLIYIVLLTGISVMLSALLRSTRHIYILLSVVVVGSAALCPIYMDLAVAVPALEAVRCLLPPYWMWLLPGHLLLGSLAAILSLLGGVALLVARYWAMEKYRLHPGKNR